MSRRFAPIASIVRPAWAGGQIKSHPGWLLPLLLIVAASCVLEVVAHPVRTDQTLAHIPHTATPAELEVVRTGLDADLLVDLSMVPVKVTASVVLEVIVLGLLIAGSGAGSHPRFSQLFALCVGLSAIGLLETVAEIAYLSAVPDLHGFPAFPWSMLALVQDRQGYDSGLLLTSINLFTLWYVCALGWALSVLCSIRKTKALLIALAFRVVTAGSTIALLHLLRNAYAFTI